MIQVRFHYAIINDVICVLLAKIPSINHSITMTLYERHDCLIKSLSRLTWNETWKLRIDILWWIPFTKGQYCRKCAHVIKSSLCILSLTENIQTFVVQWQHPISHLKHCIHSFDVTFYSFVSFPTSHYVSHLYPAITDFKFGQLNTIISQIYVTSNGNSEWKWKSQHKLWLCLSKFIRFKSLVASSKRVLMVTDQLASGTGGLHHKRGCYNNR